MLWQPKLFRQSSHMVLVFDLVLELALTPLNWRTA